MSLNFKTFFSEYSEEKTQQSRQRQTFKSIACFDHVKNYIVDNTDS